MDGLLQFTTGTAQYDKVHSMLEPY